MMWIMGYNDGVESLSNIQDPLFNGRNEHRPLMPRPAITALGSSSQAFNFATTIHNPTTATTHDHLLALNHYHLAMAEHSRRELSTQQVVVSSRWNPTPEQLQTLEELYRRGTRTPSAEQIQQITAQLRRYGKIEGKNVFYWFQNHKARERQKRRRQVMVPSSDEQRQPQNNDVNTGNEENGTAQKRESITGTNRTSYEEVAQTTMNGHSNSITISDQKTLSSAQGRTKAAECKSDHGWAQFGIDDAELLHQRRNATWHAMQPSCNSSSPTNLINSCSVATTVTTNPSTVVLRSPSTDIITCSNIQEPMVNNLFFEPYFVNAHENLDNDGDNHHDAQTLQLFPLRSDGEECVSEGEFGPSMLRNATSTSFTISPNYQFFEFLPLKN